MITQAYEILHKVIFLALESYAAYYLEAKFVMKGTASILETAINPPRWRSSIHVDAKL